MPFRPNASKGLWLPLNIPFACLCLSVSHTDTSNFNVTSILSIQSCVLALYIIRLNKSYFKNETQTTDSNGSSENELELSVPHLFSNRSRRFQLLLIGSTSLVLWMYSYSGLSLCFFTSLLLFFLQSSVSRWLYEEHSTTFSPGEWLMAGQCISLPVSYSVFALLSKCSTSLPFTTCKMQSFIQISVVISSLLVLVLNMHCRPCSPKASLLKLLVFTGLFVVGGVTIGSLVVGEMLPLYVMDMILFGGLRRLTLFSWWGWWSLFAWAVTSVSTQNISVSMVRKVYHLVAVMVYVSGVVFDPVLLKLATVAASIVCLLLEMIRVKKIPPLANQLTKAFSKFLDDKDQSGSLILSPLYLLVGLSLPLWLYSIPDPIANRSYFFYSSSLSDQNCSSDILVSCCSVRVSTLALLSGVLSVGIGDTFASIGGVLYGTHKWPGTKKSIEGSACGIVAQLVVILFLWLCGCIEVTSSGGILQWMVGLLSTLVACALVEAFTDQVDNLILPLMMFSGLILTER